MVFLSTPSAGRATLRKEGDFRFQPCRFHRTRHFYPRPPQGGRPHAYKDYASIIAFLSTPSARRATSDVLQLRTSDLISIHALREEGDCQCPENIGRAYKFLSTPSARRATMSGNETTSNQRHFYPRPPQGGRQFNIYGSLRIAEFLSTPSARRATQPGFMLQEIRNISIHALRKEGDFRPAVRAMPRLYFYPRPPQGGRPHFF